MGSDQDRGCNTGLSLDLLGFNTAANNGFKKVERPLKYDHVYPGLSLGPVVDQGFSVSPGSSSYSNNNYSVSVKRSLDQEDLGGSHGEEVEVDKVSSRASDEEEASPRKKLRLNKDQAAVLEDSFKEHSTLNPHQKQALAKRLNLRPRQVEVWFQNRRARTKLKQTEMDCELLKKCCETLTEENKSLQKEVHDLKTLKLATPAVYMQVPALPARGSSSPRLPSPTTTAATATASPPPLKAAPPLFFPTSTGLILRNSSLTHPLLVKKR